MYCRRCGKEAADNALFCRYCGKELAKKDANAVKVSSSKSDIDIYDDIINTSNTASINKESRQGLRPWAIALIAAGGVILTIMFIIIIIGASSGSMEETYVPETTYYESPQDVIDELFYDTDYSNADKEEKIDIMGDMLSRLESQGSITELEYNESCEYFTFRYLDGGKGFISFDEKGDDFNAIGGKNAANETVANAPVSTVDGGIVDVLILNAFEDSPYRRDYYESLEAQWDAMGVNTEVDISVTLDDLLRIDDYDVTVLAMHGTHDGDAPVICIDYSMESAERYYSDYISEMIAIAYDSEGNKSYWVYPEFFEEHYNAGDLSGKLIFAESCCFYGCDCVSSAYNENFSDTFLNLSAGAVVGYRNSVAADYSRNIMKHTLEAMFNGRTVLEGLADAQAVYGENDAVININNHKYIAYPILDGDQNAVIASNIKTTGYDGLWGTGRTACDVCAKNIYELLADIEIINEDTIRLGLEWHGIYTAKNLTVNIDANGRGVFTAYDGNNRIEGEILLSKDRVLVAVKYSTLKNINTGTFTLMRVYTDICEGHDESASVTLTDGEYNIKIRKGTFRDSSEGTYAYAEITQNITLNNSYVAGLKAGDIIDLSAYGHKNIKVEYIQTKNEYGNEYIFINNKPYYLMRISGAASWNIVGANDVILKYVVKDTELLFPNSCKVVDMQTYYATGQGKPEQVMKNIRVLYNQPMVSYDDYLTIKVTGGKITEARMYYSP